MEPSISTLRVAARLSNAFVMDLVKLGGGQRQDVVGALLRAALLLANLAPVIRDPALQRRYATLDADVPDEMRRPASISAMSNSLRLPYETVRRKIGQMAEAGICLVTAKGVIVPGAATNTPFYRMACQAQYEKLQVLYGRLRAIEAIEPPPRAIWPFDPDDPPYRLAGRVTAEYVLRLTEPIREHISDIVTGLALMEMINANTEHMADDEGADAAEPSTFLADDRRAPISAHALAERLGVPSETMRRHVKQLLADGYCVHGKDGYVVPGEVLARPPFPQFMLDNRAHLSRLFSALGELGVLALWEQKRLDARAA